MQRLLLSLVALWLLLLVSISASLAQVSAVPSLMPFQGRLTRPDGTPVPNGTHTLTFKLFSTPTGGTALWSHTLPVTVRNGTFAAMLGGSTGSKSGPLTSSLFTGDRFLEMQIGTDAPLTPRQPVASIAYAMKADSVKDGSITSASLVDGAVTSADIQNGTLTAADLAAGTLNPLAWLLGGNSGSSPATHFLGTTDNQSLVFKTNNTERMRILGSGGNVGIGTNTPLNKLSVVGNANVTGNVGIGIAAPNFPLAFANTLGDKLSLYDSEGVPGGVHYGFGIQGSLLQIHSSSQFSDIAFGYGSSANFTEIMRIRGDGKVGIGILDPSAKLEVDTQGATAVRAKSNLNNGTGVFAVANGPSAFGVHGFSNGGFAIYANGRAGGSSGWQVSSDARYKQHVAAIENPLDTILNLRGVTFDWKRDEFKEMNLTQGRQIGFIAQEVETILPEIVHTDGKGYKSVIYANVVPVLVEAMKQQQKQMEMMKTQKDAEIAELRARLDALTEAIAELKASREHR